jgi:flagellar biosynthesis protein FliR
MQQAMEQLVPLILVGLRLSGLFILAPLLSSIAIPAKVKVLLTTVLAVVIFPLVPPPPVVTVDGFQLAFLAVTEVLVGAVIGALALIPLAMAQFAGVIMGQHVGLSLATVLNPTLETEGDLTGEVLMHVALVLFLTMGGLDALFMCVAKSFSAVPIGTVSMEWAPRRLFVGLLHSGFELAIRVSAPVVGLVMVETVCSAMLMKSLPQMNIMTLGVGLKIIIGIGVLILTLQTLEIAIADDLGMSMRSILAWADTPASQRPPEMPGVPLGAPAGGAR